MDQNCKFSKIAALSKKFSLKILSNLFLALLVWKLYDLVQAFTFLHISIPKFDIEEKKSQIKWLNIKRLLVGHISIPKKIDLNIDEFYSMIELLLKFFKTFILP